MMLRSLKGTSIVILSASERKHNPECVGLVDGRFKVLSSFLPNQSPKLLPTCLCVNVVFTLMHLFQSFLFFNFLLLFSIDFPHTFFPKMY
jgi:hypothetical protein